jgi:hypothetical protein
MKHPIPNDFSEALCYHLAEEDERVLDDEGTLTTQVRGSHVEIKVRLRAW